MIFQPKPEIEFKSFQLLAREVKALIGIRAQGPRFVSCDCSKLPPSLSCDMLVCSTTDALKSEPRITLGFLLNIFDQEKIKDKYDDQTEMK